MKSRITLLITTCATAFFVAASAQAADRYYIAANSDWSTAANWSSTDCSGSGGAGAPTPGQDAVICSNNIVTLDVSPSVGSLEIQTSAVLNTSNQHLGVGDTLNLSGSAARLNVQDQGTLELSGNSASHVVADNAEIRLVADESVMAITNSATIGGLGKIVGLDPAAKVEITDAKQLVNAATMEGAFEITQPSGSATFINQSVVNANANATLRISAATVQSASGEDRWQATANGAKLEFASTSSYSSMAGDFRISNSGAEIEVNSAMTNTGRLDLSSGLLDVKATLTMGSGTNPAEITGGQIVVASGATFMHN